MSHTVSRGLFFLLLAGFITAGTSVTPIDGSRTLALAQQNENEKAANDAFCAQVGGQREVRHVYDYPTGSGDMGSSHVFVDCETEERVYEGGLDKPSSLDSVQQALFFARVTGKKPVVVIYDTDGRIGPYEYRIRVACELAGVEYLTKDLSTEARAARGHPHVK